MVKRIHELLRGKDLHLCICRYVGMNVIVLCEEIVGKQQQQLGTYTSKAHMKKDGRRKNLSKLVRGLVLTWPLSKMY